MEASSELQLLRAEVEQKIGRNLLRYQLVELRLKQVLPFRYLDVSRSGVEAILASRKSVQEATLGKLIGDYAREIVTSPGEGRQLFEEELSRFTDKRNRLVHHLLADSHLLATPQHCKDCISRLDEEYGAAESLARQVQEYHQFVVKAVKLFADELSMQESGPLDPWILLEGLGRRLADDTSMRNIDVQFVAPLLALLARTLESVENSHRRSDGWTDFNHFAREIKKDVAGLPKGILPIARQLTQYEFAERAPREGGGFTWMYRSKPVGRESQAHPAL